MTSLLHSFILCLLSRAVYNEISTIKTAYFGVGCFWGGEANFGKLDGVLKTRVGYAGGDEPNPTYDKIKDHTEIVEVLYDNSEIDYKDLLDSFWAYHNPTIRFRGRYQSAILYMDENEKGLALESLNATKAKYAPRSVETYVKKFDRFYQAEDYHQKYWLKEEKDIFKRFNLTDQEVADSKLATKLNAYLSKSGTDELLQKVKTEFNLSDDLVNALKNTKI